MDASTIDAMGSVAFEQMLADEWAVTRSDIYWQGYGPTPLINAVQPIGPQRALERLKVSAGQLVQLLRSWHAQSPWKAWARQSGMAERRDRRDHAAG
jgi:hypothetical protein